MHYTAISLSELGLERPPIAAFPRLGTYSYQDENNRARALDLLIDLILPDSIAYLSAARWGVFSPRLADCSFGLPISVLGKVFLNFPG